MTPEELQQIRERCERRNDSFDARDEFARHARTDVPALLDEVERLTRELQVERCGVRPIDELLQRVTTDRDELHVAWKREREEVERLTRERDLSLSAWESAGMQGRTAQSAMLELTRERDEARRIANAAVRELNAASAQAFIREQDVRALRDAAYERGAEAMRRACIQETGIVAALEELWIGPEDE